MQDVLNKLVDFWNNVALGAVIRVICAFLILIIGIKLAKYLSRKIAKSRGIKRLGDTASEFLGNLLRGVFYIAVIFFALSTVGVSATVFASVITSAGIALGLALQGGLSNLAGGFIIVAFRPFEAGDYIEVGNYSGTVTDIGIFYTTLKTPDNRKIVLPNGVITSSEVTDYSTHATRRMDVVFSVSYSANSDDVRNAIAGVIDADERILKDPEPDIFMSAHAGSAVEWTARFWTPSEEYWNVRNEIFEKAKAAFDRNGIEIPFPQMDVHIREGK